MKAKLLNPVVFLQADISRKFMERHNLTPDAFVKLDEEKHILDFIREGYEALHLTGDDGILEEIDLYLKVKNESQNNRSNDTI